MNLIILVFHIFLVFTLAYWLWKRENEVIKKYFWSAMIIKILAGLSIGIIYSQYYITGDTFHYFEDGRVLAALAREDFLTYLRFLWSHNESLPIITQLKFSEPRALFFVKFISLINLATADNYWITASYFSFISFLGAWFLFRKIHKFFPDSTLNAFLAFLFFPSIVLWTSGLIKEALAYTTLCYLTALFLQVWFENTIRIIQSVLAIIALWILWGLKYYYAAIFIPVVFTCLAFKFISHYIFKPKNLLTETILWLTIFIFPLIIISLTHPNFYIHRFLEVIVSNNEAYNKFSAPDDIIIYDALKPQVGSILKNAPVALFSGLFRLFVFEANNAFKIMAGIENLLLLILFLSSLKNLKLALVSNHRILILGLIVYVSLLCIFLALSTPNFGTLSRYRIGYLSYFIFVILCNNPIVNFTQRSWSRLGT